MNMQKRVRVPLPGLPVWTVQDYVSFALHLPVGLVGFWLLQDFPLQGVFLNAGFFAYQILEQVSTRDTAYVDLRGYLTGLVLGAWLLW